MASRARILDDRTIIINYLVGEYLNGGARLSNLRKRKIIVDAVDEIFQLRYFPRDPESVAWYRGQVFKILERMTSILDK